MAHHGLSLHIEASPGLLISTYFTIDQVFIRLIYRIYFITSGTIMNFLSIFKETERLTQTRKKIPQIN